jgi:asparagine synthase (glutamine-hydrolysing)
VCGICGELRFDGARLSGGELVDMRDRLAHRGPDSAGAFVSPSGGAGLAFRRLRIIDLTANANQPMPNEDGSVQVVFNGEIYNFRELRRGLAGRGHHFRSNSDTETIVHLYEEKGAECVAELDGMFAIAIWDARASRLTLARDRVGKKPLFYYRSNQIFAFASEIKALLAHPDIDAEIDQETIPHYLIHGYVPHPATFYKDVRHVEPGSYMTIEADGRVASRRYWQLDYPPPSDVSSTSREDAIAGIRERLAAAVERRLISDVPLGAFLSGGIDSTIVVGLMSRFATEPVRTFSIGFDGDDAYDETAYARLAAERFKTNHTEFRVAPSAVDLIDTLIWHYDGPFGDSSAVPTYLVSKLAREHVTVVLTGDGGDELFAGYRRFWAALQFERLPRPVAHAGRAVFSRLRPRVHERHWLADARRFFLAAAVAPDERTIFWNALFYDDLAGLLRPDFVRCLPPIDPLRPLAAERARMRGRSALSRMLHLNFTSYLHDDLLVKVDRMTMANSLEARSPFLDRALIEFAAALPDRFKITGRRTKAILRDAFPDLLPPEIERRGKMGFGVPVGGWFRRGLREYVRETLLPGAARYRDMLNGAVVEDLVRRHLAGEINAGPQLWSVICLERWLQVLPDWRRPAGVHAARVGP